MVCILFSRPCHDGQMAYLYYFSKELVKLAKLKQHRTINKEKERANKVNILKIIKSQKPKLIMFNGHGSPSVICGHKNEIIICEENPEILANSITYSFSCSSAAKLGRLAIERGAESFIGYNLDFAIGKDPDREATPARDKVAKLFLEPSNILFSSLIKGSNVETAVKRAKDKMIENVWYLNTTNDFPEAPHYAPYLFSNFIGLVALGNTQTSI